MNLTTAQKACILYRGARASHRPSKKMGRIAVLANAQELLRDNERSLHKRYPKTIKTALRDGLNNLKGA